MMDKIIITFSSKLCSFVFFNGEIIKNCYKLYHVNLGILAPKDLTNLQKTLP